MFIDGTVCLPKNVMRTEVATSQGPVPPAAVQLASNTSPKRDAKHSPCKAGPCRIVAMKDAVACAKTVVYIFAEDVVMEEIADVVSRVAIKVAAINKDSGRLSVSLIVGTHLPLEMQRIPLLDP